MLLLLLLCCLSIVWLNKQSLKRTDGQTEGRIDQWTDAVRKRCISAAKKMYFSFIFERAAKNEKRKRGKTTKRLSSNSKLICIANWRATIQLQFMCITISERVSVFPLFFFCFLWLFSFSFGKDFIQTAGGECEVYKSELKLLISIILLMDSKMRSCARRLQWFVRILWMKSISQSIVSVLYFLLFLFYWLLIFQMQLTNLSFNLISLNTIQSFVRVCQFIVVYTVTYVYLIASMS